MLNLHVKVSKYDFFLLFKFFTTTLIFIYLSFTHTALLLFGISVQFPALKVAFNSTPTKVTSDSGGLQCQCLINNTLTVIYTVNVLFILHKLILPILRMNKETRWRDEAYGWSFKKITDNSCDSIRNLSSWRTWCPTSATKPLSS